MGRGHSDDEESESESEAEKSSSEMSSSDESSEDIAKTQGFLFGHHLNTYTKTKRERLEAAESKDSIKKNFKSKMKKKRLEKEAYKGSSNEKKLRNKPMAMVLPKVIRAKADRHYGNKKEIRRGSSKITQLGKWTKATK
jgi:hypothetical protein